MAETAPSSARYSALQHRNFRLIWAGQIVSNVGTWMQSVGTGWLVLQLTNSPLWLGLLGLSFALPMIVLPLFGGAVVDRVNRIKLLYITQTCQMLNAFALALLTFLGVVTVWHILAASFIGATLLAFDNPARNALIPDIVPKRDLLNALSLNGAIFSGAALVGPALAGVLLVPLGAASLFFINGISFFAMLSALIFLTNVPTHGGGERISFVASMRAGLFYAWQDRLLRVLLFLFAITAIFGRSYQVLLPVFARDIWHGGPSGYGLLLSVSGAGALAGAFGLASIKEVKRRESVLIVSGLVFSLSLVLFAVSPTLLVGSLCMFLAGVAVTVFGTLVATFIQIATPNELRGRVMSLYTVCLIGLPSLGALGSGAFAELLGGINGAPRAVLVGAVLMGVILIAFAPLVLRRGVDGCHVNRES
ncbi:MAG: MFS transporter [Desulfuromonadales bacterium]|nr:MFS transporter [Desulfuromonadales bacterium]